MKPDASISSIIRRRRIAKWEREQAQTELIAAPMLHKASIEAKLIGLGSGRQFENFFRCGVEEIFSTCTGCGKSEKFYYSCNRKWCPRCVPKLTGARVEKVRLWASRIEQPKHLVLTCANFPVLTGKRIRAFARSLVRLRARDVWADVRGGCCSIEITNEGRGWHLHAHLLLDTRWVDMPELSRVWAELVGQDFAIVKIKDVRGQDYVNEVAKYVAKGSELAKWPGEQLWEFIHAIKGKRFFFAFGSLFKLGKEIKRELAQAHAGGRVCACGCGKFLYQTEADVVLDEINAAKGIHRRRRA